MEVPPEGLPQVEETATPFGLTPEQHAKLKELWYERGHYASRDRMWELLKAEAREDGELEERTVNRKDGLVVMRLVKSNDRRDNQKEPRAKYRPEQYIAIDGAFLPCTFRHLRQYLKHRHHPLGILSPIY